jgi:hypothetical protein
MVMVIYMARYGFSGSKEASKIYVLYLLRLCGGSVEREELRRLFMLDDNASHFVFSDVCEELLSSGLIGQDAQGCVFPTESGLMSAAVLEKDLPAVLRRAALKAAAPVIERITRSKTVKGDVIYENGIVFALLSLTDGSGTLAEIKLAAGSAAQAEAIAQRWRSLADELYLSLLEGLTGQTLR